MSTRTTFVYNENYKGLTPYQECSLCHAKLFKKTRGHKKNCTANPKQNYGPYFFGPQLVKELVELDRLKENNPARFGISIKFLRKHFGYLLNPAPTTRYTYSYDPELEYQSTIIQCAECKEADIKKEEIRHKENCSNQTRFNVTFGPVLVQYIVDGIITEPIDGITLEVLENEFYPIVKSLRDNSNYKELMKLVRKESICNCCGYPVIEEESVCDCGHSEYESVCDCGHSEYEHPHGYCQAHDCLCEYYGQPTQEYENHNIIEVDGPGSFRLVE